MRQKLYGRKLKRRKRGPEKTAEKMFVKENPSENVGSHRDLGFGHFSRFEQDGLLKYLRVVGSSRPGIISNTQRENKKPLWK
jgi:hypothetical protein